MKSNDLILNQLTEKFPHFFRELLSQFYPFSEEELYRFANIVDWELVNCNSAIAWDEALIKKFDYFLNWALFSQNGVWANQDLLARFADKIDWKGVVKDGFCGYSIASNESICWTSELIGNYQDRLNFNYLSQNEHVVWTEQLLEKFCDRWNWENLLMNKSIPWTLPLFEKYLGRMDTRSFFFQFNEVLTANWEIVDKYGHLFDPQALWMNPNLPWKELDLVNRWMEKIEWRGIAANSTLLSDRQFFEAHVDRWLKSEDDSFSLLSGNEGLHWSFELIDRYLDEWDWFVLSSNTSLPWSKALIERYKDLWEWGGSYDNEVNVDENGEALKEPFLSKQTFPGLVTNTAIPWSADLILEHADRIDFDLLAGNDSVWAEVFKPLLTKEVANDLLGKS